MRPQPYPLTKWALGNLGLKNTGVYACKDLGRRGPGFEGLRRLVALIDGGELPS